MIKKILVLISFSMITSSMMGQIGGGKNDGFFSPLTETKNRMMSFPLDYSGFASHENLEYEQIGTPVPLGSATLPLTILGISYLFTKSKRKEENI